MPSKTVQAHIALFLVALIYGANYIIAKEVMDQEYIQPLGFILLRVLSGLVLFWLFAGFFIRKKIDWKDFPRIAACAVFGVATNQLFFFSGLKLTTPINAALIMTTTPMLVLVASALIIGERITSRKVLGILSGAAGAILLISYGKELSFNRAQLLGDLFIFINAAAFGVYLVIVRSLMLKYHPVTVMKWVFSFGIGLVFPFGFEQVGQVDWTHFPPSIWLAVAYVLVCTTFLTYLFNAFALKIVNPSTVSIYIYLQPLIAAILAITFAKDTFSWPKVLAAVLIFIGVHLVSRGNDQ
ncbi:MAG: DMT family transporter [Bacteroidota bacterium]